MPATRVIFTLIRAACHSKHPLFLAALLIFPSLIPAAVQSPGGPNIIVILADDLGYGELSVQGSKDIPTPKIDSIARSGVRFTQGYVSCAVCAPTRAGLLTGRYQQRFGFETNPGPEAYAAENFGLPRSESTLAERLKSLGYATGMVGKWHLGFKAGLQPPQRGFAEFFGFLSGANNYIAQGRRNSMLRGTTPVEEPEYLTDAFGREAVAFIEQHRAKPFFLYLAFNAVHSPLQATENYESRYPSISDAKRRTYAGMTAAMDDAVGRVLGKLRTLQLEERTLIFFLSDNGGPTPQTTSRNDPLRGYKGQVLEGGIRIPFMVQWKGKIPAGKTFAQPVISLDIFPTAVVAAGGTIPADWKLDGVDLLPFLTGKKKGSPHDSLYWRMRDQHALRRGDWKLVVTGRDSRPQLYNLAADISESDNLAAKQPARLKELTDDWQAWNAQMMDPLWIRQDAANSGTQGGQGRTQPGAGGGAQARRQMSVEERFKRADRNGDGRLTPEEFPNPQMFQVLDRNGDGVITLDEAKGAPRNESRPPR